MDVGTWADEIDAALWERAVPGRAEKEKAYLKSDLNHYGVPVPATRSVAKEFKRSHPDVGHDVLLELVDGLWAEPVHERRTVAVELLAAYGELLTVADLPLLERLLREARTWAIVDDLAAAVVGPIVEADPVAADELDRWATDPDLWIRRSAMLALLVPLRKGGGDFDRFTRYADSMLDEREFFIAKAIGWVLRDTARKRPDMVFTWFLPRAARASSVTVREVLKPLSTSQQAAIRAARAVA